MKVLKWVGRLRTDTMWEIVDIKEDTCYYTTGPFTYRMKSGGIEVYSIELLTRFMDPDVQKYIKLFWDPTACNGLLEMYLQYMGAPGDVVATITML